MKRAPRIHFRHSEELPTQCGIHHVRKSPLVTDDKDKVTCGSCKRMLFVLNFDIDERTRHGKKVILK